MDITCKPLFAGHGRGTLLMVAEPISFWGGVDPETGRIIKTGHAQEGALIASSVIALPALIGSSSTSAVMLELLRTGNAPAALILGHVDAILVVGCLAGRELGYACPPVVSMSVDALQQLRAGDYEVTATETSASVSIT